MKPCAVCGKPVEKYLLFEPSAIAVYLCQDHTRLHQKNGSPPIEHWVKTHKIINTYLDKYIRAEKAVHDNRHN